MGRIKLVIQKNNDIFLLMTRVENLFISEFLPDAPGDYVKVFLLGLMYAQYDQAMDSHELAMRLGLSGDEVEEAWIYWESCGAVRRRMTVEDGQEICMVEFISLVQDLYGRKPEPAVIDPAESSAAASASLAAEAAASSFPAGEGGSGSGVEGGKGSDFDYEEAAEYELNAYMSIDDLDYEDALADKLTDKRLRALYRKYQDVTGRTVSRRETGKIEDAIRDYGIEPEIFDFAIDYCADLEKYSIDYIFKVALRWTEEGCRTVDEAKRLLDRHSLRNTWYSQVFRELGFNRLPAPADREIMDRWFDVMKFGIDEVLDACRAAAGIRDPNLRYVNKVLENRRLEKGGINTFKNNGGERDGRYRGAAVNQADGDTNESASMVSKKVLNDYFEYIRAEEERYRDARMEEIKREIPEMTKLFADENAMNRRLLTIRPGETGRGARQALREDRRELEERKRELLARSGYPADYLNIHYRCDICKDTGYTDEGMVCSCCRKRAEEAYKWIGEKNSR